jgi:hypothetical protein
MAATGIFQLASSTVAFPPCQAVEIDGGSLVNAILVAIKDVASSINVKGDILSARVSAAASQNGSHQADFVTGQRQVQARIVTTQEDGARTEFLISIY